MSRLNLRHKHGGDADQRLESTLRPSCSPVHWPSPAACFDLPVTGLGLALGLFSAPNRDCQYGEYDGSKLVLMHPGGFLSLPSLPSLPCCQFVLHVGRLSDSLFEWSFPRSCTVSGCLLAPFASPTLPDFAFYLDPRAGSGIPTDSLRCQFR